MVDGEEQVSDIRSTYLLYCPEGRLRLFVHFPDVRMLDGEDDKTSWVFSENWFIFCFGIVVVMVSVSILNQMKIKRNLNMLQIITSLDVTSGWYRNRVNVSQVQQVYNPTS